MNEISRDLHGLYNFKSEYFPVGDVVITRGIRNIIGLSFDAARCIVDCVMRYCRKDWGDLCFDDVILNEEEVECQDGNMSLFASYKTVYGKIYISTNRKSETQGDYVTTVYLPEER